METTTFLINAVYDTKTGEILLAHPQDENVFVTANHYNELISDKEQRPRTNCIYTERTVCTQSVFTGSGPICTQTMVVKTCNCS
jgi:predicted peptidase